MLSKYIYMFFLGGVSFISFPLILQWLIAVLKKTSLTK